MTISTTGQGSRLLRLPVVVLLVAGCAAIGFGCAGVQVSYLSETAPRQVLESGSRVRVHLFQPQAEVLGNVVRVRADTLVIAPEDAQGELVLSASNVRRVEVSLGRRSRRGTGAVVGLLVGAAAGLGGIAYACADSCVGAVGLLALPVGGALIGAGIGAGIGSLIRTDRWQAASWR